VFGSFQQTRIFDMVEEEEDFLKIMAVKTSPFSVV
jgi:hypothetical protein